MNWSTKDQSLDRIFNLDCGWYYVKAGRGNSNSNKQKHNYIQILDLNKHQEIRFKDAGRRKHTNVKRSWLWRCRNVSRRKFAGALLIEYPRTADCPGRAGWSSHKYGIIHLHHTGGGGTLFAEDVLSFRFLQSDFKYISVYLDQDI